MKNSMVRKTKKTHFLIEIVGAVLIALAACIMTILTVILLSITRLNKYDMVVLTVITVETVVEIAIAIAIYKQMIKIEGLADNRAQ